MGWCRCGPDRWNRWCYFDVAFDVTEDFIEQQFVIWDYSDFGGTTVWNKALDISFLDDKVR
jgi:hypothetical protein